MACLRYSSYLLKDSATANTVIDNSFGTPQNDLQLNGHISKTTYLQYISLIPTKAAVHTDYAQAFKRLVNCAAVPWGYEFA